jgi:uncharacterized protein (DUF1697 family)
VSVVPVVQPANNNDVRYVALLRGINVGGKNIVRMADLRACFEQLGFTRVTTYIQSGNVVFESRLRDSGRLSAIIGDAVAREFGCSSVVLVVSGDQIADVISNAPAGFGERPGEYKYDVAFVKPPLCARAVLPTVRLRAGVDEACAGIGVLYFRRLTEKAKQSYLPKLVQHPAYRGMTVRNWNTTLALHRLLSGRRLSSGSSQEID